MADDDVVTQLIKIRGVLENIEVNTGAQDSFGIESRMDDVMGMLTKILKELKKGK